MHQTPTRNRRSAIALAALLGLGLFGGGVAAADIGDITSCPVVTHGDICPDEDPVPDPDLPDTPDEITNPEPDPIIDFPAPEGEPGPDDEAAPEVDPEDGPDADPTDLPDAEVDGTVVADATFTG
jgi:hypothetical protein